MLRGMFAVLVILLTFPACLDPVLPETSNPGSNNTSTEWQGEEDLDHWNLIVHFNKTENISSVAADSDGNVYAIGYVSGAMTTGLSNQYSWWIKKYDSTGREIRIGWDKRFVFESTYSRGFKIIVAKDNTVYAAGYYQPSIYQYLEVLHFSANGDLLESIDLNDNTGEVTDFLVDDSGNIYVCGYYNSSNTSSVGSYTANGVQRWKKDITVAGKNTYVKAVSMAFDINGNLLVAGTGRELVSTDSATDSWYRAYSVSDGSVVYENYFTMFLKSGNLLNPDSIPTVDVVRKIAVGKNGNIYLAGYGYNIRIYIKDLGNGVSMTSPVNCNSGFVLGFNSSKQVIFDKRFSTKPEYDSDVFNMILDSEDNIIVTGIDKYSTVLNAKEWFIIRFAADKSSWIKSSPVIGDSCGFGLAATAGTSFFAGACFENLYSQTSGQDWWIRKFY